MRGKHSVRLPQICGMICINLQTICHICVQIGLCCKHFPHQLFFWFSGQPDKPVIVNDCAEFRLCRQIEHLFQTARGKRFSAILIFARKQDFFKPATRIFFIARKRTKISGYDFLPADIYFPARRRRKSAYFRLSALPVHNISLLPRRFLCGDPESRAPAEKLSVLCPYEKSSSRFNN